jgi:hypothetical protein
VKRISVLMPTITGREEMRGQMVAAFDARSPGFDVEVVSPLDFPNWPSGCNEAQRLATGDYFLFTADDLEPLDGWADAMVACLDEGFVPAPQVWNWARSGRPVDEHVDGPPGAIAAFSRIPALTREMAEAIGPWPESLTYYGDNWASDAARLRGWESRVTEGFCFVHHWHQHGRLDTQPGGHRRWLPAYNEERAKLGLPPVDR